jgi:hypothetical protein
MRTALVLSALCFTACIRTPEIRDKILSEAQSPSGKWKATVIERDAGLAPTSIIVFVHPSTKRPDDGQAVVAITDGSPPGVTFVDDTRLQVRLFGGTTYNQLKEALGLTIIYE